MVARETVVREALAELGLSEADDEFATRRLAFLAEFLGTEGVRRGFISSRDTDRILPRHVLECAALQLWLPRVGRVVDVGSGAGLPGLVLACLRPDPMVLIEATGRRASFLREVSHELELGTEVLADRAEILAHGQLRESAAAVVARALARVPVALELTLPFAAVGGVGLLLIGSRDAAAIASSRGSGRADAQRAEEAAVELGAAAPDVRGFEVPGANERRWVMIVRKLRPTPDPYPRPAQVRRRCPLGGGVA